LDKRFIVGNTDLTDLSLEELQKEAQILAGSK
jgi:hypothetical protein